MFAFILGCLYLIFALIYLLLIKENFNIFGFIYNPRNKKLLIVFDAPFLLISFAAMLEEAHWLFLAIFFMHLFNTTTLQFKPEFFYQLKDEMKLIDESSFNNYLVIMTSIVGIGCLLVSYL